VTAVYMTRAALLTFGGRPADAHSHPHESGALMLWPMGVLAVLAVTGGALGAQSVGEPLVHFLGPLLALTTEGAAGAEGAAQAAAAHPPALLLAGLSIGVAAVGLIVGWTTHRDRRDPSLGAVGTFFERGWYLNDLYDALIVGPAKRLAGWLAGPIDQGLIDAAVNGVGRILEAGGEAARRLQTGYARQYALVLFIGAILVVGYWVFR